MVTGDDYAFGVFSAVLLTTVIVGLISLVIGLSATNSRLHSELRKERDKDKKKKDE